MTIKLTPTQHRALIMVGVLQKKIDKSQETQEAFGGHLVTFGDKGCDFGFLTGLKLWSNLKLISGESKMMLTGQKMNAIGEMISSFGNVFYASGLTDLGRSTLKEVGDNPRRKNEVVSKPMLRVLTGLPLDGSGYPIYAAPMTLKALCKRGLIESDAQKYVYNLTDAGIAKRKELEVSP
jgi:hypothetical protein